MLIIGLGLSLAALVRTNASFNGTISDLNLKASQADERAGTAMEHAATFEKEAAMLRDRAAGLEKQNLKLQDRILELQVAAAPRRLTESQKSALVKELHKVPPAEIQFCVPDPTDPRDVSDFTDDFIDVFVRAQLMQRPRGIQASQTILGMQRTTGVAISVNNLSEYPRAATIILRDLKKWGFKATLGPDPRMVPTTDIVRICVGRKQ